VETLADQIAVAIENARLVERARELAASEERNRLAREIHDTLAQGLAAITLHLEMVDTLLESAAAPRAREVVQRALALARANMEEARRSVHGLRAAPLDGRTLAQALTTLAAESAAQGGLIIDVDIVDGSRPLPVRVETGVYRIAQEALANVLRHAQARHATLHLLTLPDRLHLTIDDDGQGFDPAQVPGSSYGLIGLNERARLLGGSLHVQSTPGAGTRLDVDIPLDGKR
jgi:two-component system NarL family sensor kinase